MSASYPYGIVLEDHQLHSVTALDLLLGGVQGNAVGQSASTNTGVHGEDSGDNMLCVSKSWNL